MTVNHFGDTGMGIFCEIPGKVAFLRYFRYTVLYSRESEKMREKFAIVILLTAAAVLGCTACGKKKQLNADLSAHEAIPL